MEVENRKLCISARNSFFFTYLKFAKNSNEIWKITHNDMYYLLLPVSLKYSSNPSLLLRFQVPLRSISIADFLLLLKFRFTRTDDELTFAVEFRTMLPTHSPLRSASR